MPKRPIAATLALIVATSLVLASPAQAVGNRCSAKVQTSNPALGKFYGVVQDTTTGKILLDIRGSQPTQSASVLKLLTASAALFSVPEDYRASTRVFRSTSDPTTLILVGGGDHTLSAFNQPSYTTYKNPPKISALASIALKKIGASAKINKIVVDTSFFDETDFNKFWLPTDRTNGYVSVISPLMADADRANGDLTSTKYSAFRSTNPATRAGQYLRSALGSQASGAKVVDGLLPDDSVLLATVRSQPITEWIEHALHVSDNTETEIVARHVEKYLGLPTTFAAIQPMVKQMLSSLGIDQTGLVMKDASGLSQSDRVTARLVAAVLTESVKPESPIRFLSGFMAAPTSYGSLTARFDGPRAVARDSLVAKSGFIPGLSSLAGLVQARDYSTLAFAFFAKSDPKHGFNISYETKDAIDGLVAKAYLCGLNLTK